jgi:hypothetical protein
LKTRSTENYFLYGINIGITKQFKKPCPLIKREEAKRGAIPFENSFGIFLAV